MSGHNKWSTIKHRKGAQDAKRSKVWTKVSKEITVAARLGGGDADSNPRLRGALLSARAANMPKVNVERAIKKGTGDLDGVTYEAVSYEGYGPDGVAFIVDGLTDNTNRTVSEVRSIFSKRGGNMGAPGAVGWMFEEKGQITLPGDAIDFDTLFEAAVDAGAEDVEDAGEAGFVVTTAREELYVVVGALEAAGITPGEAGLARLPTNTVTLETAHAAGKVLRLIEALEDNDDVQDVWSNADISDEIAAELAEL